jgi:hypothetical protein
MNPPIARNNQRTEIVGEADMESQIDIFEADDE